MCKEDDACVNSMWSIRDSVQSILSSWPPCMICWHTTYLWEHLQYHAQDVVIQWLSIAPDGMHWNIGIAFPPYTYLIVAVNMWTFDSQGQTFATCRVLATPKISRLGTKHHLCSWVCQKKMAAEIPKLCIWNPRHNCLATLWQQLGQQLHHYYFGKANEETNKIMEALPTIHVPWWLLGAARAVLVQECSVQIWFPMVLHDCISSPAMEYE